MNINNEFQTEQPYILANQMVLHLILEYDINNLKKYKIGLTFNIHNYTDAKKVMLSFRLNSFMSYSNHKIPENFSTSIRLGPSSQVTPDTTGFLFFIKTLYSFPNNKFLGCITYYAVTGTIRYRVEIWVVKINSKYAPDDYRPIAA